MYAGEQVVEFLEVHGMPQGVNGVRCEHVEEFITDLLRRLKPATASIRYRALQQFWKWCVEEGEVERSPMARMVPPKVPEDPPTLGVVA